MSVFDVAEYRRKLGFQRIPDLRSIEDQETSKKCYDNALCDLEEFLRAHDNGVGIYDASSITHAIRHRIKCKVQSIGCKLMFIQVENDDPKFLSDQYKLTAVSSPDYADINGSPEAEEDYRLRVQSYEAHYERLCDCHSIESKWSFLICDHSKQHYVVHNVRGHLPLKVVNFVINLRTTSHAFYLSRHGQSEYNVEGRIGGNSGLSEHGVNYAKKLAKFVDEELKRDKDGNVVPARLWSSTMRRTVETTQFITNETIIVKDEHDDSLEHEWVQMRLRQWFHLDEIFAGACDGMTYAEIEEQYPEEFELRKHDKLAYRYPRGESYLDVIARLEPIIIEMERHREPLLIVGHQGILRIIYAFYTGLKRAEAPYVSIPLNTVIKLVPTAHDIKVERKTLYRPTIHLPSDGQDEIPEDQRPIDTSVNLDPPSH